VDAACSAFGRLPGTDETLTWIAIAGSGGDIAAVSLYQWTGRTSALVHVSGPFDWLRPTISSLLPLVVERYLMLYDVQAQSIYNNQRHYPTPTGKGSGLPEPPPVTFDRPQPGTAQSPGSA
jgi:hypothetical protein